MTSGLHQLKSDITVKLHWFRYTTDDKREPLLLPLDMTVCSTMKVAAKMPIARTIQAVASIKIQNAHPDASLLYLRRFPCIAPKINSRQGRSVNIWVPAKAKQMLTLLRNALNGGRWLARRSSA